MKRGIIVYLVTIMFIVSMQLASYYGNAKLLDQKDLKFLSKYNIKQLLDVQKSESQKGEEESIAKIFNKYYNKSYHD